MKTTSYRKAQCFHVSEASKNACPLCNVIKSRKPRKSKYTILFGYKIDNAEFTSVGQALKIAQRLKRAAARKSGKRVRRPAVNTTGFLRSVK